MVLNRRFLLFWILCLTLTACLAQAAQAEVFSGYVRLHVLAADDTEAAQALKLEVRDACLERAREWLADCWDADQAWAVLNDHAKDMESAARARLAALGSGEDVRCELGVFEFPDRQYGAVRVPAGEYRALRVVIGAGEGRNWWCVLYPSLCYPEALPADEPVVFHSSIWNWLKKLFGGESA